MNFRCVLCDRSFVSNGALQQHKQDSSAHAFNRTTYDNRYESSTTLQQSIRGSSGRILCFTCGACGQSFNRKKALKTHLRDLPGHDSTLSKCEGCDRSFNDIKALEQHIKDSSIHRNNTARLLDGPSYSMPTLDSGPPLLLPASYATSGKQRMWGNGSTTSEEAWSQYQCLLKSGLHMWHNVENDSDAWSTLCRVIDVVSDARK